MIDRPDDDTPQPWVVQSKEEGTLLVGLMAGAELTFGYYGDQLTLVTTRNSLLKVLDEFNRFGVEAGFLDKPQSI